MDWPYLGKVQTQEPNDRKTNNLLWVSNPKGKVSNIALRKISIIKHRSCKIKKKEIFVRRNPDVKIKITKITAAKGKNKLKNAVAIKKKKRIIPKGGSRK